jgi:hypothetical protein
LRYKFDFISPAFDPSSPSDNNQNPYLFFIAQALLAKVFLLFNETMHSSGDMESCGPDLVTDSPNIQNDPQKSIQEETGPDDPFGNEEMAEVRYRTMTWW